MSALQRLLQLDARALRDVVRAKKPELSKEERGALRVLRKEALAAGVKLKSGTGGGPPPSMVLHHMRKAGWLCQACGGSTLPLRLVRAQSGLSSAGVLCDGCPGG